MFNIKSFPNKTQVGTFSPFDQIVRLDGFTQKDVQEIFDGDSLSKWKKAFDLFRTINHEYTHFLDMTTTTYGLSVLTDIFSASTAFSENKDSTLNLGADRVRRVLTEINKHEVHSNVSSSFNKTWAYREWFADARSHEAEECYVLTGTIFSNPENKTEVARAPFSIPSLLESNALANELLFCHVYTQSKIPSDIDRKKLIESINKEMLSFIYNPDFCLYTVCFHRCANALNNKEIIDASLISALICEMCLDASPLTLQNISPHADTLLYVGLPLRNRIIKEIKDGSRPLLFFLLTSLLANAKYGVNDLTNLRVELEQKAGLKNFAIEAANAKKGLFNILSRRKNTNPQFENFLAIIKENLQVKKSVQHYQFHQYELPSVLLKDGSPFRVSTPYPQQVSSKFNPAQHAEWMSNYHAWL